VALLLTFAAGCVDIIGYLTIYKVFTAHMTGVTVHLAQNAADRQWAKAAPMACVLGAFLIGSVFARTLIEVGARRRVRSIASATLLCEAVLIAAAAIVAGRLGSLVPVFVLVAMLAFAMGVQTATLTRIGSLTVHTTFVTGMLNKLAQLLSHAMFLTYDIRHGQNAVAARDKSLRQAGFIFSIWALYLVGAATGTWMQSVWGVRSMLLPAGMVAIAIGIDQASPLAVEEEHDQPER
jgi:uncharacterized membrane protein YoaK (UPF0700 family)